MAEFDEIITAHRAYSSASKWDSAYGCLRYAYEADPAQAYPEIIKYREKLTAGVRQGAKGAVHMYDVLRDTYLLTAKDKFDDYCIALEWNKEPGARFYLPRREGLKPIVRELQRLADDELDLLGISAPPGIGKTGVAGFFITWLAGKHPDEGILIGSHNGSFLRGLYEEFLRELDPNGIYAWAQIFPGHRVVKTNAQDMKIDVDRAQRFSTIQLSSIESGNAGKVRAVQLLYCDDLVEGIEEAMSESRLETKWTKYTTDLKQRKQGNCKELHIATRWAVRDVVGRIEDANADNPRAEFINLPALNEKDESNFAYGGSNGFTTAFYHNIRETMDEISWNALYMGKPMEREGRLYDPDTIMRYTNLPEGEPDAIIGVCDTANGGGDYTVLPVFAKYGTEHYMIDCVCSDGLPEVTDSLCADMLVKHKVKMCQFESNSAGSRTADVVQQKVEDLCKTKGQVPCKILKKHSQAEKTTKIIVNSPFIKNHCHFKDERIILRGSPYAIFMRQMFSYTTVGKNKHDDVPDALAQYTLFVDGLGGATVQLVKRPF